MRKPSRNMVRTRGKRVLNSYTQKVCLFAYEQSTARWREWTYRTVSLRQALQQVADGEATPITRDLNGQVTTVGFQAVHPTRRDRPSPCTLTLATTIAVANGVAAKGVKPDLTAREREEIFKFRVWPLIGDEKSRLVRPRLTPEELREAEALLPAARPRVIAIRASAARVRPRLQQAA